MKSILSAFKSNAQLPLFIPSRVKTVRCLAFCGSALWLLMAAPTFAAVNINETFSTNPISSGRWSFGVGSNANSQFVYQSSAPAYAGDSAGSLAVHFDSTLPTARLELGLGVTLTDTDSFTLTTEFSFTLSHASPDQSMQLAFGLVNHSATGGDRTGTFTSNADTFQAIEFDYYPNVSPLYGGPTLTPTVFGAQVGGGSPFSNFASVFGPGSDLGDNTTGITSLPQSVNLQVKLIYVGGSTKQLTLELYQIDTATGSLTQLVTGVPTMDLVALGYDSSHPFTVDTLAIMAYQDGFTNSSDPSLVADMTIQRMAVTSAAPEPTTSLLLLGVGLVGAARARPRSRK